MEHTEAKSILVKSYVRGMLDAIHAKEEYERRVQAYEAQGMTRSDAQGVVEAEDMQS